MGEHDTLKDDSGTAPSTDANASKPLKRADAEPKVAGRTLTATAQQLLEAPDEERIANIQRDRFIPYEAGEKVLDRMEYLLKHQVVSRPQSLLIVAAPNNGKSTLLNEFLRRHSGSDNEAGGALHMPVVLVPAPSEPKKIEFEDAMLRVLRVDPKNTLDKKAVICSRLEMYRTRIIALDEVSMLLAGSPTNQRRVLNDIRFVSNGSKTTIVMAGSEEMLNVLRLDAHSDRRFTSMLIKRWKPSEKDFKKFLWSFEATLPLRKASNLHKMAQLIYELTECLMGDVVQLLKDSAVTAIERGTECIDEEVLRSCRLVRRVSKEELALL